MKCAGCSATVPIVGGNILRMTGQPDRNLCGDCAQAVERSVKATLSDRRFSNIIRQASFSSALQEA